MSEFSSPFSYFVFLHWSWFTFCLVVYIVVFQLTHWKTFVNWGG